MKDFLEEISKIASVKALSYLLGASVVVGSSYYAYKEVEAPSSDDSEEEIIVADNNEGMAKRSPSRKPSSLFQKDNSASKRPAKVGQPIIEEKNESNFVNAENPSEYYAPEEKDKDNSSFFGGSAGSNFGGPIAMSSSGSYGGASGSSGSGGSRGSSSSGGSRSPSSSSGGGGTGENIILGGGLGIVTPPSTDTGGGGGVLNPDPNSCTGCSEGGGGGGGGTTTTQTNECTPSVLSGAFGNPFGVTISCTLPSTIKYCLAKDVCCDPNTAGTSYTKAVVIGAETGNFCLSFYGEASSGEDTEVSQHNYTVNFSLPNLTVGMTKTQYQTTELEGTSFMTSTDFGKPNYFIGQMNFKTNDPGSGGLNLDCEEIVENDHLGLSPMPSTMLNIFDVSVILSSAQVTIPFKADRLSYGLNYLVSYVKNNSYVSPLYSCATNPIRLEDFEYFEVTNAQSSTEFEGQFTSYGFFEADADVYRGPAGQSSENKSGTFLESGLMSIFY